MRLFISINFDQKTKNNILKVQSRLKECGKGNFSREENLHLTLAFLGEIDEERIDGIKAAMNAVDMPHLEMKFSDIGFFGDVKEHSSQLWWIGLEKNPKLMTLQKELSEELKSRGFTLDERTFKPHITLVRQMSLQKWDKKKLMPDTFTTEADHMSLMHSHRIDGKLIYTEIYRR